MMKTETKLTKVGLTIVRCNPVHRGHCRIFSKMIEDCETVIIGLGSAGVPRSRSNPFTVEQRSDMLRKIYGERIKIVPLRDLGATDGTNNWVDYVLEKLDKISLPPVSDLYCGSEADGSWYRERFWKEYFSLPYSDDEKYKIKNTKLMRYLHIIDRDNSPFPSASEIRTFIELGNDMWKKYVPENIHDDIERLYPKQFLVGKN